MPDCLAASGSASPLPVLLLGLAVVLAGAVAIVVARRRSGRRSGSGRALMLALLAVVGVGALTFGGGISPARAAVAPATVSVVTAGAGCASAAPSPAPTTSPIIGADQEVTFTSGGVAFHGSFRGPIDPSKPVPAVVIVVGTGDVDRDGNAPTLATEAYAWLADVLSANGIASLRYDKLGTGATGLGPYASDPDAMLTLGYEQLRVQPIRDALAFMAVRPGVDPSRILLLGHSEGGADALIVATDPGNSPALAGLLLIEPAYTRILDVVGTQFAIQIDAAVTAGVMTSADADTLKAWLADGVQEIRTATPPYPAPGPVPLPGATGVTELYQNTIASNIYGSDPAQMVITHAYRTLYGKQYDSVDPDDLPPHVTVPTLITCGTKDFNTPCGDGTPGSGVIAVAGGFAPGVVSLATIPNMVHILRDVGSADVPQPADQIAYPFSTVLEQTIGDWTARFGDAAASPPQG